MTVQVRQTNEGKHVVEDAAGKVLAGPFDTNAKAWRALDRIDGQPISPSEKRSAFVVEKILTSGPAPIMPSKKSKKRLRKMKKAAAKAPRWLRDGAAGHFDPNGQRHYRDFKLGTLGPASEVRHIDPADYKPSR